jgi:threonine dehydrogenase-like Zn-dependent dehydrogenase
VLKRAGARVVLFGKHAAKLAVAAARGIETATPAEAQEAKRTFAVVVEASGAEAGFALALDLLEPQGALVLKSTFHGSAAIDTSRIVVDEIKVLGSRCGRLGLALDLLARRAVDVESLVSERLPLARGEEALALAARPGVLKVLLSPG